MSGRRPWRGAWRAGSFVAVRVIALAAAGAFAASVAAADAWERLSEAVAKPPAESERDIEALVLENPSFHAAHYDLGTLQLERDPAKAASHLETAATAPNRELAADANHNLAIARWRQGRLDDALIASVRAADLNPEFAPFRDQMRKAVLVAKDQARLKAEEEAKKLKIPSATLPVASVGVAYEAHVVARGGAGGYAFTIAGDTHLPKGIAIETDGRVHGVPLEAGSTSLTIAVKDAAQATATGAVVLPIVPPPEILTERLPEAIAGQPYRATVRVAGVSQPRWQAFGLPDGLEIASAPDGGAVISGTTGALGTHPIELRVDEGARQAHRTLDLLVSDSFAPDASELPAATAWAAYRQRVGVRGPAQEYHWKLAGDGGGLSIADDGTITGAPDKAGDLRLAVELSAADGRARPAELVLPVNPPPVIQEGEAIKAVQGEPFERRLAASGGTPPLAWSLADGMLPKGFRLDPDGALRGATAETGDFTVSVALSDHWKASTKQELKLTVTPSEHPPQDQKPQPKPKPDDQHPDKDQGQDQAKDQQKDQQKQDQSGKDNGKDPGKDQAKDQADNGKDPGDGKDPGANQKQGDPKKDEQAKDPGKPGEQGRDEKNPSGGDDQRTAEAKKNGDDQRDEAARQMQTLDQAAGDRWLEQLPKEDRGALRGQLLRGANAPHQKGNPW